MPSPCRIETRQNIARLLRHVPASVRDGILYVGVAGNGAMQEESLWVAERSHQTLDISPAYGADIVADIRATGLPDASFRVIVLSQTIEHIYEKEQAIAECVRLLAPDGWLLIDCPWMYPVHAEADFGDFWRITADGLTRMLYAAGFAFVDAVQSEHVSSAIACKSQPATPDAAAPATVDPAHLRIAILGQPPGLPIANLLLPLTAELRARGHDVTYFAYPAEFEDHAADFDIVHLGHLWMALARDTLPVSTRLTLHSHHIEAGEGVERAATRLAHLRPDRIVVSDRYWQQWLGWGGVYNVTRIPQAFDSAPFSSLPMPPIFTAGWLGTDYPSKRFDVARQACEEAGVAFVDGRRRDRLEDESPDWLASPLDFYRRISVYIVTTFTDTGPLPPQEALLCGRPVISTAVGMMPDAIEEGWNGLMFDGSVADLKRALLDAKRNFEQLAAGAAMTRLPSTTDVTDAFEEMWRRLIVEAA